VTHADAACAFESLLVLEPMTPAQMYEGGLGPYAKRRVAVAQTGGDGETREFETQTGDGDGENENARAVAAQCPDDLSARREDLEAQSALEASNGGGGRNAAAARRQLAAAQKAAKWARASGDLQHSREKRLAGFIARAGAETEALLREWRFIDSSTKAKAADLMRTRGSSLKPHAVQGQPGSLTEAYVALEEQELTNGRRVTAAAFAPDEKGARSLLVAYAPRDTRARRRRKRRAARVGSGRVPEIDHTRDDPGGLAELRRVGPAYARGVVLWRRPVRHGGGRGVRVGPARAGVGGGPFGWRA
jgi:hypothetical protein